MKGRGRRQLFRLLWRNDVRGSVSALARQARLGFSTTHAELERMRAAGVAVAERVGTELVYRSDADHPEAELLRRLAALPDTPARLTRPNDDQVLTWLANVGAPVGSRDQGTPTPTLEQVDQRSPPAVAAVHVPQHRRRFRCDSRPIATAFPPRIATVAIDRPRAPAKASQASFPRS